MNGSEIIVRHAYEAEAGLLAELGARTFRDAFGSRNTQENMDRYIASSFSPEMQAAEMAESGAAFLIAEVNGAPVGFAHLRAQEAPASVKASRPLEIARIYAIREWIGRGVGAALMRASLDEAHRRGCDVVWLAVWEHNLSAIEFYRKWEFVAAGTQPFQLGNDTQSDVLMRRPAP